MRQYARIEQDKPAQQPRPRPDSKDKHEEVDFDISHEDLTDEYTIL